MISRFDITGRLLGLAVWLAAGATYWWLRPAPSTQIEIAGRMWPPIPEGWAFAPTDGQVERLFLIPFVVVGLFYLWVGGTRSGGPSIWVTVFLAFLGLATVMLGTFPLRHDWIIAPLQTLTDPTDDLDLTDNVALLFSLAGLFLTFVGLVAVFRIRMADPVWRDQSRSQYFWSTMLHGWYGGHRGQSRHDGELHDRRPPL